MQPAVSQHASALCFFYRNLAKGIIMKIKRIFAALLSGLLIFIEISGTGTKTVQAAVTWPSGPNPDKLSCDSAQNHMTACLD